MATPMKTNKLFPTFLLVLATLLVPLSSWAQDESAKSLKECIEYGLKNFGTVRIAQYKVETANQAGPRSPEPLPAAGNSNGHVHQQH